MIEPPEVTAEIRHGLLSDSRLGTIYGYRVHGHTSRTQGIDSRGQLGAADCVEGWQVRLPHGFYPREASVEGECGPCWTA
jgi:hypothetical protein